MDYVALLDHGTIDLPRLLAVVVHPDAQHPLTLFPRALHPQDDELPRNLDVADLGEVDNDVAEAAAVEHEDARAGRVVGVAGQRGLRAHKEGALDARLFPALGDAVEDVDDGVGGDAEDAEDGGHVALEDGEVELGVFAQGRRRVRLLGCDGRVGLVVGDGRDKVRGLALVAAGFSWCRAAHDVW
ncbi:hypothetical protein LLEC1_04993 [Akanthomyces lecanii]|uniref:Uncharacterized protein n=1 Tax=Cordyceps confragosa TaxID=2714763 RepID=A0A179I6F7_CORDF|nr:hypothetical protein LLEC1_04993 [Akanthomyces lecanii]